MEDAELRNILFSIQGLSLIHIFQTKKVTCGSKRETCTCGVIAEDRDSKTTLEYFCGDIVLSHETETVSYTHLGQPISQSAYRMERTSEFLRKSLEAPITEEDIVKIATSICGLFKDVEERVYRVYLNKSDILREKEPAEHIVEELERKNTVAAYGSLLEE